MKRLSRVILPIILTLLTICCFVGCGNKTDKTVYDTKYLGYDKQYYALGGIAAQHMAA